MKMLLNNDTYFIVFFKDLSFSSIYTCVKCMNKGCWCLAFQVCRRTSTLYVYIVIMPSTILGVMTYPFLETMIRPEDVREYRLSSSYKATKKLIEDTDLGSYVSKDIHSKIRNQIIAELVINNATRTGGIINMTLEQVEKAIYIESRDCYVIKVYTLLALCYILQDCDIACIILII